MEPITSRVVALVVLALGVATAGCAATAVGPTYTQADLQVICERQGGWWRPDDLMGGDCEYQGPGRAWR